MIQTASEIPTQVTARYAVPPTVDEQQALADILGAYLGHPVSVVSEIDPQIIGGIWIRIGDQVIDGSLAGRLEMLRHHLRAQTRIAASTISPPQPPTPSQSERQ